MQLVTDTRMRGECEGFNGDSVFSLDNGQVWQQIQYKYRYRYKYRPKVKIWRNGGQHLIEIEGMSDMVRVQRLQ